MARRIILFVCDGNRLRSPMAAAICQAELSALEASRDMEVVSAGVSASDGRPLKAHGRQALQSLGVPVPAHQSQPITVELLDAAERIYCMTDAQREAIVAMAPSAAPRITRLDPEAELPEPAADEVTEFGQRLRNLIRERIVPVLE